ncbi:DUF4279 domain-containing protein [Listeria monocytogenes]|nr:DUF4279 domain-containing protein [Listeria monocytogenes]
MGIRNRKIILQGCMLAIEKLIRQLQGKRNVINSLCNDLNLKVIFTVVINMENEAGPELVLTKEIIGFVCAINAEVGFDIYVD